MKFVKDLHNGQSIAVKIHLDRSLVSQVKDTRDSEIVKLSENVFTAVNMHKEQMVRVDDVYFLSNDAHVFTCTRSNVSCVNGKKKGHHQKTSDVSEWYA